MTSLGIVPGIKFFVSGHFLILFIDLTNLPEALCVQKICRGIIHFDPTTPSKTLVKIRQFDIIFRSSGKYNSTHVSLFYIFVDKSSSTDVGGGGLKMTPVSLSIVK